MIDRMLDLFSCPFSFLNLWWLKRKSNVGVFRRAYYKKLSRKGSYIGHKCVIDEFTIFPHGITGIFISGGAMIGKNCTIYQHVTIGANEKKDSKTYGYPIIGNNVFIGANSTIVGHVVIGDNVYIGAGTVVTKDIPVGATVVGNGVRIIEH